jgi:uncharacterized membrane protein YsdA (DUF1294 family)/cold shock CspA family protein
MQFQGTLTTWHPDRGFGFIAPSEGGDDVFVHIKAFKRRDFQPVVGQVLAFEVELGPNGKKRAKQVEWVRQAVAPSRVRKRAGSAPWGTATLLAIPAFLVVFGVVTFVWNPSPVWMAVYLGMSVITFAVYAWDKSAAQQNRGRTPESTLHTLALAGGWPGALLAQQYLRHKSAKAEFRQVFWATVVLNVVGFVAVSSGWMSNPLGG